MLKKLKLNGSMKTYPTEWLHFHFSLSCIGEGNSNPLQCSCLENPRDGGNPSGLPSMGSHGVGHDWGDLAWRPTRPSRSNTQKRCLFHSRGLECKSRKSRDIWSNRQVWPWSTEWSRAKTKRVLTRKHPGHSQHPFPTTQEMTLHMNITRQSILKSDWLYPLQLKMEKLLI